MNEADAPEPPLPETTPLASAPPEIAKEATDEAPPFQRPTLRTVLAAHFWAGLLGGGTWLWCAGTYVLLKSIELVPQLGDGIIFVALVPAMLIALTRGSRAPVRSYADLAGRLLGALFFGALWTALAGLCAALISDALRSRDVTYVAMALLGAPMSGG